MPDQFGGVLVAQPSTGDQFGGVAVAQPDAAPGQPGFLARGAQALNPMNLLNAYGEALSGAGHPYSATADFVAKGVDEYSQHGDMTRAILTSLPMIGPLAQDLYNKNWKGAAGTLAGAALGGAILDAANGPSAEEVLPAGSKAARPGQTVRAQIPVEQAPASPPSPGVAVAKDILAVASPRAAAALKLGGKLADAVKNKPAATRPMDVTVTNRPAPAWQSLPDGPDIPVEPAQPVGAPPALPSGRVVGTGEGAPPIVQPPRAAPAWQSLPDAAQGQAAPPGAPSGPVALPSGRIAGGAAFRPNALAPPIDAEMDPAAAEGNSAPSMAGRMPPGTQPALPVPNVQPAPAPATQTANPDLAAAFKVDQAAADAASAKTTAAAGAAKARNQAVKAANGGDQVAWAKEMAQRLYRGQITAEDAALLDNKDLDLVARNNGKYQLPPASRMSPDVIPYMRMQLRGLWNAAQPANAPPVGYAGLAAK